MHGVQLLLFLDSCICLCLFFPLFFPPRRRFTAFWSSSFQSPRRITWHIFFVVREYIYICIYTQLSFFLCKDSRPSVGPPPPISILGLMHEECRVPRNNIFRVFRDPCNIRNIFMNIWADHTVRAGHSVRAPICFMKFERGKRVAVRKVSLSRTREGREEGWHRGGWTISLYWRRCLGSAQPITENAGIV